MGRKKKRTGVDMKPFCYYCDREFDDETVLIQHQKAKHFKCSQCNRRLDMAGGLVVHMMQVHKETISSVPNALPGREDPMLEVYGMQGIPMEMVNERRQKLMDERGYTKQQKSAHTVFGMSVMHGMLNDMMGPSSSNFWNMPGGANNAAMMRNPFLNMMQAMPGMVMPGAAGAKPLMMPGVSPVGVAAQAAAMPNTPGAPPASGVMSMIGSVASPAQAPQSAAAIGAPPAGPPGVSSHAVASADARPAEAAARQGEVPKANGMAVLQTVKATITHGRLVYDDDLVSMEERRATQAKYNYRPRC